MNISGHSIATAYRKSAADPLPLILLHDSLNHSPKRLTPKLGGSAGGHNGVTSVQAAMGSSKGPFWSFQMGIGRQSSKNHPQADYVMARLPKEEAEYWSVEGVQRVVEELEKIVVAQ